MPKRFTLADTVKHRASPRMRAGTSTDDYRAALSGEGEFMSLGYEWSDKPHRLVYDLCGEIDHLRSALDAALNELDHIVEAQIKAKFKV